MTNKEHHEAMGDLHRGLSETCQKAADTCEAHNEAHPSEIAAAALDCFGEMAGYHSQIADNHDAMIGKRRSKSNGIDSLRKALET